MIIVFYYKFNNHFFMKNLFWYHSLKQPLFSPPDWLFAPVWTVLYLLMIVSFVLFFKTGELNRKIVPISLFFIQLVLNLSWSPIFFGLKNIKIALLVCIALVIFIFFTILSFYKYSKVAAVLLIPYFLWCCFALYLNFSIYWLNR